MTREQDKICKRCAAMLKRAFPALKGSIKFNLLSGSNKVKREYKDYEEDEVEKE